MNSGPESSPPVVPPAPQLTPERVALPPLHRGPRESKSIHVPVLKPSLIPFDVMQAHKAELAEQERAKELQRPAPLPPVLESPARARERVLERFFGGAGVLAGLDPAVRARLFESFDEREVKAGEVLVFEGEVANFVAVVLQGELVLEDRTRLGHNATRFSVTMGHVLAVVSAMLGVPSRFKVSAAGQTRLLWLSHRRLTELTAEAPLLAKLPERLPAAARQLDRDLFWDNSGVPLG